VAETIFLKAAGLYTSVNSLASAPAGSMSIAKNIVIDSNDVISSRRGFKVYGDDLGTSSDRTKQLMVYRDTILVHYSDVLQRDNNSNPGNFIQYKEQKWIYASSLTRSGSTATFTSQRPHGLVSGDIVIISGANGSEYNGAFQVVVTGINTFTYTVTGTPITPDTGDAVLECSTIHVNQIDANNKIRGLESFNSNFYFTGSKGVKKLDSVDGFVVPAGGIKALDLDLETVPVSQTAPMMPQNSQVAYRVLWGYTDANKNIIKGSPSQRAVISLSIQELLIPQINSLRSKLDTAAGADSTDDLSDTNYVSSISALPLSATALQINSKLKEIASKIELDLDYTFTANGGSGTITANTAANPTVVTSTGHGLTTGDTIRITGSNSTPPINGKHVITRLTANTFSVPVAVTTAGTAGSWVSEGSARYGRSGNITNNTVASPTVITSVGHSLTTGDIVVITGSNSTPSINGEYVVTRTGVDTFTIPVAVTSAGSTGTWTSGLARKYPNPINNNPSDYLNQQNFFDDIISTLISEPVGKISASALTAGDFEESEKGKDVELTFTVPQGITTNYFYQVYRTNASVNVDVDPGDDMKLVIEKNPTTAELKAGLITVVDSTPDSFKGEDLYTSPRQEGIAQSNDPPPFAKDIAVFKNMAFYANTKTVQRLFLTIVGIDNLTGKKIRIGNITYTFSSTENISLAQIQVFTTGLPSQNVDDTARSMVRVINRHANNTNIYARYISGTTDAPGKIVLESRDLNDPAFKVLCNDFTVGSTNFNPNIAPQNNPITSISVSGTTTVTTTNPHGLVTGDKIFIVGSNSTPTIDGTRVVTVTGTNTFTVPVSVTVAGTEGAWKKESEVETSDNESVKNRVYYSKLGLHEAVPEINFFNVGSGEKEIQRIVPLRDSLFVLKTDGVFRISGESPQSLSLVPFDNSTAIVAPDTAVVGNNQVFCFTNQGVTTISDTGVSVISEPLKDDILNITKFPNIQSTSFAVFYDTDRKYLLWLPESPNDISAPKAYCYNTTTNSWTNWNISKTAGVVSTGNDRLYLGAADINNIEIERKDFKRSDFSDREFDLTVIQYLSSEKTVRLNSISNASIGDVLVQNQTHTNNYGSYTITVEAKITAINLLASEVTVETIYDFELGSIKLYKAIDIQVKWLPETAGSPGVLKHFREAILRFNDSRITTPKLAFSSDLQPGVEEIPLIGPGLGLWGSFPWGSLPWGGEQTQRGIRTYIPTGKQRCSLLNCEFRHKVARENWKLEALSLILESLSHRINR